MSKQLKYIPWQGWEEVEKIGEGSFGAVYKIKHSLLGTEEYAALKVISVPWNKSNIKSMRAEGMDDEAITKSIKDEADNVLNEYKNLLALQGTPNIVHCKMVHCEEHSDAKGYDIYILMELLTPLLERVNELKGVEKQVIRFGMEMCDALVACENKGILHRDIKPENVFVSETGIYKLGDFGIARSMDHTTYATQGVGTPSYMAPEVDNGEKYSKQADIYSLGIMLYWLLNEGRIPFLPLPPKPVTGTDRQTALKRRKNGEQIPAPKNGSKELQAIVLKACSFDPKDRYQSAREMLEALKQLSADVAEPEFEQQPTPDGQEEPEENTVGPVFTQKSSNGEEETNRTVGPQFPHKRKVIDEPEPERHHMRKGFAYILCLLGVIAIVSTIALSGNKNKTKVTIPVVLHQHEWREANYNNPKTCITCGEIEGSKKEPTARLQLADIIEFSTATSVMEQRGIEDFGPDNLYDQNTLTYWVEGADGSGIGESAKLHFNSTYAIKELTFLVGSQYQVDSTYFTMHNRPSKLKLHFSDGTSESIYLQDTSDYQTVILSEYHYSTYVEITIEEVYAGTHWNETPFAEVDVLAYNP